MRSKPVIVKITWEVVILAKHMTRGWKNDMWRTFRDLNQSGGGIGLGIWWEEPAGARQVRMVEVANDTGHGVKLAVTVWTLCLAPIWSHRSSVKCRWVGGRGW